MNREILYRGKWLPNLLSHESTEGVTKWVYGVPMIPSNLNPDVAYMLTEISEIVVRRDTIGQFTGLHDKHGTRIFEGDVFGSEPLRCYVIWHDYGFKMKFRDNRIGLQAFNYMGLLERSEIIGNIHTSPDLIK